MSYGFRSKFYPLKERRNGIIGQDLRPLHAGDIALLKQKFRLRGISDNRPGSWQGYSILEHCPEFLIDYLDLPVNSGRPFRLAVLFNNTSRPNSILCRNASEGFLLIDPDSGSIELFPSIPPILAVLEQSITTH